MKRSMAASGLAGVAAALALVSACPAAAPLPNEGMLVRPEGAWRALEFRIEGRLERIGQVQAAPDMAVDVHLALRDGRVSYAWALQRGPVGAERINDLRLGSLALEKDRLAGTLEGTFLCGREGPAVLAIDAKVAEGEVQGTCSLTVDYPTMGSKITNRFEGVLRAPLRTEEDCRKAVALPADAAWPCWHGPQASFAAKAGCTIVPSLKEARLVWLSEAEILAGRGGEKEGGGHPYGGYASPIVGGGRIFLNQWAPSGDVAEKDASSKTTDRRVNADDVIWCFDAATGQLLWKRVFPGAGLNLAKGNKHEYLNNTGCYKDGRVYMFGFTWRIYALEAATGRVLWQSDLGPAHQEAERAKAEGLKDARMVSLPDENKFLDMSGGVLFTNDLKGGVTAFDPDTGKPAWTVAASGFIGRWAFEGKDYILVQEPGGVLACIVPKSGQVAWKSLIKGSVLRLGVAGPHLVSACGSAKQGDVRLAFYRLDGRGATPEWETAEVGEPVGWNCMDEKNLYLVAIDKQGAPSLVRVDLEGRKVAARVPWPGGGWSAAMFVADGRLFVNVDIAHAQSPLAMGDAGTLQRLQERPWSQPHLATSAYDAPMAIPYVDGRLFFRGMKRLACYDIRRPEPGSSP